MIKIYRPEQLAIRKVVEYGQAYGYGNLIAHLASAWAAELVEMGMDEEAAMEHVSGRTPYPIVMHIALVEQGEYAPETREVKCGPKPKRR